MNRTGSITNFNLLHNESWLESIDKANRAQNCALIPIDRLLFEFNEEMKVNHDKEQELLVQKAIRAQSVSISFNRHCYRFTDEKRKKNVTN